MTALLPSRIASKFPINDCDNPDKEFLIVFDCRHDIRNQIEQFSKITITYLKQGRNWRKLDVKYMTNTWNGLIQLSQRNHTSLSSSAHELEKNCSSDVSIDNILETTRNYFVPKQNTIQISFIMLGQNLSTTLGDRSFVQTIADRQDNERNVRRFFVVVASDQRNYPARDYILYTSTFQKTNLYDFFLKVCNANCTYKSTNFSVDENFVSHYHFNYSESVSKRQAEFHCQKNYNSYLTSPESDEELDFLLSHIFPMNSNVIETKVIFLGLNKIKGSKEFIWDSKNPFVQRVPGISQSVKTSDRDICVYLNVTSNENSTSAVSKVKVHDKYLIEWITVNCFKKIPNVNIACECHVIQPNDKKSEDHFIIHNETPSFSVLPTRNVIYALNTLFFYDQRNESRFIAPQTSADVQKFECDTKKMSRLDTLRQYLCRFENFNINNQNCSSYCNNYTIIEMANSTKISSYYNYLLTTKRWSETGTNVTSDIIDYTNNTSNEFNNMYYIKCDNDTYAPKCIFAKYENNIHLLGCSDNLHLQDCKDFKCSTGYFKCPKSYCIPLYQVNDGVNDCPRGEDENVIFKTNSPQCTGHMVLKAYDMCLETDIWHLIHKDIIDGVVFLNPNKEYICKVPCSQNLTCFSSVTKDKNVNSSTFYFTSISISSPFFKVSDILLPHSRNLYILTLFKPIELRIPGCGVNDFNLEFQKFDKSELSVLDLSRNQIATSKQLIQMSNLTNLRFLNLSYNTDFDIDQNFTFPSTLEIVDVSNTKIQAMPRNVFQNLTYLKHLNLSYTAVSSFDEFGIPGNFKLKSLDIRGIEIKEIHRNYFQSLSISDMLLASDYRLCCKVILGTNIPVEKCQAPSDAISTCQHLVGDTLKRVIIWIVGTITVIGNGFVLYFRITWNSEVKTKSYILFVIGLAVSDLVMGVYLIIIASADIYFRNDYVLKESSWRYGALCHFAGFLSTVSSETSTFFICWITYDRYIKVKYTFGEKRISERLKYAAFLSSWILGLSLALIPAVYSEWEIYSSNGMCLALPLNTGHFKGWEYSFAVFVFLNFVLFIFIAAGQVAIFLNIIQSRKHFQVRAHGKDEKLEISAAKNLALVAISDFLCWFPIGIMGMISFNGHKYNTDVYAWVAIFILPVNSAVNPLLYTIPAIKDMQNKKRRQSAFNERSRNTFELQ
ncbi:hypothetical protein Btru_078092 [Bulinus truncatus]|nr:hypothetical protein Btru_078092 [Bulinus truncatus]